MSHSDRPDAPRDTPPEGVRESAAGDVEGAQPGWHPLRRGDITVVPVIPVAIRGEVTVPSVTVDQVVRALDHAERHAGGPLVDESERERLAAPDDVAVAWHPLAALRDDQVVGYGSVVLSGAGEVAGEVGGELRTGRSAHGDAAVLEDGAPPEVFGALLAALSAVAREAEAEGLQVWVRRAGQREVDVAAQEAFDVHRRLGVLGRGLGDLPARVEPVGHRVRAFRPGEDDDGVVAVLAAAYAGTDEAGWDLARFHERTGWSWFRAEDLLVAEAEDGHLAGLHWLKRRDATTGEVYNLAVHPDAQGHRLGPALLSAGLHHLARVGCDDVVLWVDRANERAVALYEGQGFTTRWDDIAFTAAPDGAPAG